MGNVSMYRIEAEYLQQLTEQEKAFMEHFPQADSDKSYNITEEDLNEQLKDLSEDETTELASLIDLLKDELKKAEAKGDSMVSFGLWE